MSTPPNASDANSSSTTENTDLVNAANALFISNASDAINNAIALGRFHVFLDTFQYVDLNYINTYFLGLGYNMVFLEALKFSGQPAQLFGEFWEDYWNLPSTINAHLKNPTRVMITWRQVI